VLVRVVVTVQHRLVPLPQVHAVRPGQPRSPRRGVRGQLQLVPRARYAQDDPGGCGRHTDHIWNVSELLEMIGVLR
jgi:hypothetical protein